MSWELRGLSPRSRTPLHSWPCVSSEDSSCFPVVLRPGRPLHMPGWAGRRLQVMSRGSREPPLPAQPPLGRLLALLGFLCPHQPRRHPVRPPISLDPCPEPPISRQPPPPCPRGRPTGGGQGWPARSRPRSVSSIATVSARGVTPAPGCSQGSRNDLRAQPKS